MDGQLLEKVIGTVGVALIVLDDAGQVVLCNPAACSVLGYPCDGLMGKALHEILPYSSPAALDALIPEGAGDVTLRGVKGQRRDGGLEVLAVHITPWRDEEGKSHHTLIIRAIAEELERERRQQAELIRSNNAVQGANIGVFDYDVLNDSIEKSDIWYDLMELDRAAVPDPQAAWRDSLHPDDYDRALAIADRCLVEGRQRSSGEYRVRAHKSGGWRWMLSQITVQERDAAGNPTQLIGSQMDITGRKQMEEALRQSVGRFRSSFDNAPIGKAILTPEGHWLDANSAICNFLGYSAEELVGKHFRDITHPDDLAEDHARVAQLLEGKETTYQREKRFLRPDGKVIWGLASVTLVRDSQGAPEHFLSQVIDITERHHLDKLKGEFVATVSHELRTPMTSVLGALKLLSTSGADLNGQARRLVDIAVQNGERLGRLVNDILDFEKFSVGKMQLDRMPCDIADLVKSAVQANTPFAETHGTAFEMGAPPTHLISEVDPARFDQVMANLLSNAVKFCDKRAPVRVRVETFDNRVRIGVLNCGPGVPEAFKQQIFAPFSQAAPALTRSTGGTGLGLSISKQIVEHMGGTIGFHSEENAETEFWFTLPLSARHALPAQVA